MPERERSLSSLCWMFAMQVAFGAFSAHIQRHPGGKKMFKADPQFEVKAQK